MKNKPVFSNDELYLIERTFDQMYSLLEKDMRKAAEEFLLMQATTPEDKEILKQNAQILPNLFSQIMRLGDSAQAHRMISMKCEKWRRDNAPKI